MPPSPSGRGVRGRYRPDRVRNSQERQLQAPSRALSWTQRIWGRSSDSLSLLPQDEVGSQAESAIACRDWLANMRRDTRASGAMENAKRAIAMSIDASTHATGPVSRWLSAFASDAGIWDPSATAIAAKTTALRQDVDWERVPKGKQRRRYSEGRIRPVVPDPHCEDDRDSSDQYSRDEAIVRVLTPEGRVRRMSAPAGASIARRSTAVPGPYPSFIETALPPDYQASTGAPKIQEEGCGQPPPADHAISHKDQSQRGRCRVCDGDRGRVSSQIAVVG